MDTSSFIRITFTGGNKARSHSRTCSNHFRQCTNIYPRINLPSSICQDINFALFIKGPYVASGRILTQ